jgi:hypothetical protein
MKTVNIMNFARSYEPRNLDVEKKLLDTTRQQLDLVNEMEVEATFLLQYDVYSNDEYVKMIKERAGENIELGIWYEIVEPLTTACGMKYNSSRGWKWDWYINPGFSMAYPPKEREILIDEAMRKFKEVFGYYPRTVGSWIIDTYTINYLSDNYDIDAICYCRDQINTDAYTLVGGYFNQAYYPSRNNMFTPAVTPALQGKTPMIRLLGSDPINNYDYGRFASPECKKGPYTMELTYDKVSGGNPRIVDWYLKSYFDTEDLGFSYMQIGQENSFAMFDIITPLRMQIEKVKAMSDVKIEKMCDTGRTFKKKYDTTPATAVCALDSWDSTDCQSVYYDSPLYTVNVFRHEGVTFIRALYLFDERIPDTYLDKVCTTFDSVHENMPIVDTAYQKGDTDGGYGIVLDDVAEAFKVEKVGDEELKVYWSDKSVIFKKDRVILNNCKFKFTPCMVNTKISIDREFIHYEYKGNKYSLKLEGATLHRDGETICASGDVISLIPTKI